MLLLTSITALIMSALAIYFSLKTSYTNALEEKFDESVRALKNKRDQETMQSIYASITLALTGSMFIIYSVPVAHLIQKAAPDPDLVIHPLAFGFVISVTALIAIGVLVKLTIPLTHAIVVSSAIPQYNLSIKIGACRQFARAFGGYPWRHDRQELVNEKLIYAAARYFWNAQDLRATHRKVEDVPKVLALKNEYLWLVRLAKIYNCKVLPHTANYAEILGQTEQLGAEWACGHGIPLAAK